MMARKDKVVCDLTKGIGFLFKKNGVELIEGWATIPATGPVKVGDTTYEAANILIATGSTPTPLPGVEIDEADVLSSTGALALDAVPEHLVVIGAGVIGLELGQVWSRLGAKVTVVEYLDRILPGLDGDIAKLAQRALSKRGLKFQLGRAVQSVAKGDNGLTLTMERVGKGTEETLDADKVLVTISRRPVLGGLGLDALGVAVNARGFIEVDDTFRSSVPDLYAIGDCVPDPMLAHKAEEDGITHAFTASAAEGGFAGAAVWAAIRFGVARGVFSNEAGLGSAPIAHAAAETKGPVNQGLIAMLGTFIDTIIVCSITGLAIIASGAWTSGESGAALTSLAFETSLPGFGGHMIAISLSIFAFTTILGWSYYGEKCVGYLLGAKTLLGYRLLWIVAIYFGATAELGFIWLLADTLNAMMALPNLIALALLSPVVFKVTKEFFASNGQSEEKGHAAA